MKRFLVISGILLAVGLTGAAAWVLWPRHQTFYSDAAAIREPAESARLREILWQPPIPMPGAINSTADEYEPRLSADGQTLLFVRGKPGENADIVLCTMTADGWSAPEPVSEINSDYDDLGPEISPDGQSLYFYSDRPGGIGGYDLWMSRRGESGWMPPSNLGTRVNSEFNDYGPAVTPDGGAIFFASNRPRDESESLPPQGAWHATIREDPYRHDYDLYTTSITDAGLSSAQPLAALNSPGNEGAPCFSPAGDFVYFTSDRDGGFGGFDLYRARQIRGEFEAPSNLGGSVNTAANELDPALEMGGYALHFSSDRSVGGAQAADPPGEAGPGDYNLYRTVSKEVFREVETRHASIDWAALWRQIGPNLMLALLALLLALLLLALLRDMKQRRLSLLARCLLTSLLVHLLLMLLFNVMEVTTSIASAFRKSDRIQISLAATANANEIAAQVRGELTDITAPDAIDVSPSRQDVTLESQPIEAYAEMRVDAMTHAAEDPMVEADVTESRPTEVRSSSEEATPPEFEPTPLAVNAPSEASQISAKESPTEYLPRPDEAGEVRRAETPWPTTQPALDQEVVAIAPETTHGPAALEDARSLSSSMTPTESTRPREEPIDAIPVAQSAPWLPTTIDDLGLPSETASASKRERAEESNAPVIAALPAPLPTRHRADDIPLPDSPPSVANIPPGSIAVDLPASSMVAAQTDDIRDTSANVAVALDPAAVIPAAIAQAVAPITDLSLPTDSAAPAPAPTPESSPRLTAVADAIPRAPVADAPATPARAAPTVIAPQSADAPNQTDASLVTPSAPAVESTPLPGDETAIVADVPVPPSFGALELELGLPSEVAAPTTPARGAVGTIRGRVTDIETSAPLSDVKIQLDLPGGAGVTAITGPDGEYSLIAPKVPDHFALSASAPGYLPHSVNVPARAVIGRTAEVNFPLQRAGEYVIAVEADPEVHHLGNDRFEGRINSQFQRQSEGTRFRTRFSFASEHLSANFERATVEMLAKGVQCPHQIRINGRRIDQRMGTSPVDGSFGEFVAEFDPAILRAGRNTLVVRNVTCRDDIDDFEFVNIQIRLIPAAGPTDPAPRTGQRAPNR